MPQSNVDETPQKGSINDRREGRFHRERIDQFILARRLSVLSSMVVLSITLVLVSCDDLVGGEDRDRPTTTRPQTSTCTAERLNACHGAWKGPSQMVQFSTLCQGCCATACRFGLDSDQLKLSCGNLIAFAATAAPDGDLKSWCPVCAGFVGDLKESPSGSGRVAFWTDATAGWSRISIKLDGEAVGSLTRYRNEAPQCSTVGPSTVVVTKPAGEYRYEARAEGSKWDGTLTIRSDRCLRFKLHCGPDRNCES